MPDNQMNQSSFIYIIKQEDQILLLQNAWCDLLLLDICSRTMTSVMKGDEMTGSVLLTKSHLIDGRLAESLQLTEMVSQLYDIMSMIESIQFDDNEFVTLKVLTLLSPEAGRLKDEQRVQRTQEDIIDALYVYTSSNYKDQLGKYGEILTLCAYVTNVSIHFKTYLFHKIKEIESSVQQATENESQLSPQQNYGLLMELLKGDLLFQPSYSVN